MHRLGVAATVGHGLRVLFVLRVLKHRTDEHVPFYSI
jgi:hypothetical protein